MYAENLPAIHRLNILQKLLLNLSPQRNLTRAFNVDGTVTVDDVTKEIRPPKNPEFVPQKYLTIGLDGDSVDISQTTLHHLRWMLQKDQLGQDMFLLGRPGPLRRSVAMQFLELTQRELEYISLSRDTTESDLKQRREIQGGTAIYFDQSAVRAAIEGRILVIEGVEKAERNVLPVLNNLLENREMHLEDGRFLIPSERYDKLLQQHSKAELDRWGLVRVSEDFRVIALGLPVPRYRGAPLDPPLRSRFQARDVTTLSYNELLQGVVDIAPKASLKDLEQIVSFGCAILSPESSYPDFPVDSLNNIARIINNNPNIPVHNAIYRLYPYRTFLTNDGIQGIYTLLQSLNIPLPSEEGVYHQIIDIQPSDGLNKCVGGLNGKISL